MLIMLHVIIALSSLGLTSYAFFRPSETLLRASYALVGLTLATGTYLVYLHPSRMIQACSSGLMYLGLVTVGIVAARHRLAQG